MEFRLIFDTIPEQFDAYRPRYCKELFDALIAQADIGPGKRVLEIGPGTGQATDPILATGCDYHAIELGSHLEAKMREKYGKYPNFSIVNDDFITHDFGDEKFDMIYSAATIQWIPEDVAYNKTFSLLKSGGTLAMLRTRGDYRTPNPALYEKIQAVYSAHFFPDTPYMHHGFGYDNGVNYGYVDLQKQAFESRRVFTADEYVAFCGTHCDHLVLPDEHREPFFAGLHQAVVDAGNRIEFIDTHMLTTVRKP